MITSTDKLKTFSATTAEKGLRVYDKKWVITSIDKLKTFSATTAEKGFEVCREKIGKLKVDNKR